MKPISAVLALCATLFLGATSQAQAPLTESRFSTEIISYLNQSKASNGWVSKDIENLLVLNESVSKSADLDHVYLIQTVNGIKINKAISSVAIKDAKVFYFANRFLANTEAKIRSSTPGVNAYNSLFSVLSALDITITGTPNLLSSSGNKFIFEINELTDLPVEVELYYVEVEGQLELAWETTLYLRNNLHWWKVMVDATTNEIMQRNDLILSCSFGNTVHTHTAHEPLSSEFLFSNNSVSVPSQYKVFPNPIESPNHGVRQLVANPDDPMASPFGWHDTNGVSGEEFTITRGNNVWAQEDSDGNNDVGNAPDGTDQLIFDFSLDLNRPPSEYQEASITNLFYHNNINHDIWYQYGFDEVSGNFQQNNYRKGGIGNDFVYADAQDGDGLNNATFGTPEEGLNPVMTMYLWSAPGGLEDVLTVNTGSLAGAYSGTPASFGAPIPTVVPISANLVLVEDITGDINDACDTFTNSTEISGKIAVIRRGSCQFGSKVRRAELAGAVAVIMVNNVSGGTIVMGPGAEGDLVTIPSLMVSQEDGEALIGSLNNNETISATIINNGPFELDGSFDNVIIAHEYGHGISNRLTAGASNVECLFNNEQMGEGWSDWFGLMITMSEDDTAERARGIGTYAIGQNTDGNGIRPARYSPDFGINGFTYADTNNGALSVPHGVGFVWATMLWDLTWAYIDKYGFDSDVYNGTGGNNRVMQLVLDGLKLQPCSPGFIDGRDALLAADQAITGGVDQCLIWEVFSSRGLGFDADQGDSNNRSDQVENFDMPPSDLPSLVNCNSLSSEAFDLLDLKIYPNPANSELIIATSQAIGDVQLTLTDLNGRLVFSKAIELYRLFSMDISNLKSGMYFLRVNGNGFDYNLKVIKN